LRLTCVTIDCADPDRVAAFWAEALGWTRKGSHRVEPSGGSEAAIYLEFVSVPEAKTVKNRLHLGIGTGDLDAEIARLEALGATIAWEEEFPPEWPYRNVVLRDVEGNEFCLGNEDPDEVKRLLGVEPSP
jgi:predicted enzyme related to lactoylglutathione lyase